MPAETPYVREVGYPQRYRDLRFATGCGPRTHRREVAAVQSLLLRAGVQGGPWLDMPSGAGRLSHLLPGDAWQLDRDAAMLRAGAPGRTRVCASALALPCGDGVFRGALCMRLMQHLPTTEERIACLTELRRVTRGPVLVSFFHALSIPHLRRQLRPWLGGRRSRRLAIGARQFRRELEAADLRFVSMTPLGRLFLSEQRIVLAWAG